MVLPSTEKPLSRLLSGCDVLVRPRQSAGEGSSRVDELLALLDEWRAAREAMFAADFGKMPVEEHLPFWNRLGRAEHALMTEARKRHAYHR